jgi:hypothetical protein
LQIFLLLSVANPLRNGLMQEQSGSKRWIWKLEHQFDLLDHLIYMHRLHKPQQLVKDRHRLFTLLHPLPFAAIPKNEWFNSNTSLYVYMGHDLQLY